MTSNDTRHRPVLLAETIGCLAPRDGGCLADLTVGHGFTAEALLKASGPTGRVLGVDIDASAVEAVRTRLAAFGERFRVVHGSYAELRALAAEAGFSRFEGAVIDAGGVSREQLLAEDRGFGFASEQLDMRLDLSHPGPSAATLVNTLSPAELERLFVWAGESRRTARAIASAIGRRRKSRPIATARELAGLVEETVRSAGGRRGQAHPATRTFLALRLRVNDELDTLRKGIHEAAAALEPGGRLVILSYHGLEHRLVRQTLRALENPCGCPPGLPCTCGRQPLVRKLVRHPVRPSAREVETNPSARSAQLHSVIRTQVPSDGT